VKKNSYVVIIFNNIQFNKYNKKIFCSPFVCCIEQKLLLNKGDIFFFVKRNASLKLRVILFYYTKMLDVYEFLMDPKTKLLYVTVIDKIVLIH